MNSLPVRLLGTAALLVKALEHFPKTVRSGIDPLERVFDAFEFGVAFEGFYSANEVRAGFLDGAANAANVVLKALSDVKQFPIQLFLNIQHVEQLFFRHTLRCHYFHRMAGRTSEWET